MNKKNAQDLSNIIDQASALSLSELAQLSKQLSAMVSERQARYTEQIKQAKKMLGTRTPNETLSALEAVQKEIGASNARRK